MMILGAILGFILGAGTSLAANCTSATAFWHACVTALVGGILARWCARMWLTGLADALEQQHRRAHTARIAKTPDPKTAAKV